MEYHYKKSKFPKIAIIVLIIILTISVSFYFLKPKMTGQVVQQMTEEPEVTSTQTNEICRAKLLLYCAFWMRDNYNENLKPNGGFENYSAGLNCPRFEDTPTKCEEILKTNQ